MGKRSNRYSDEFKADAIRMVKEGNRSVYSVAKDLGINSQTLSNWFKANELQQDPDYVEIRKLKKELARETQKCRTRGGRTDLKKGHSHLLGEQKPEIVYQHIRTMNEDEDKQPGTSETGSKFSVEKMCKYLGVSRSGYYDG